MNSRGDRPGAAAQTLSVAHVIAGLDLAHGGPSYSVPRLCQALAEAGTQATLLSVAAAGEPSSETDDCGFVDRRFAWDLARVPGLRSLRRSAALEAALVEAAPNVDVIHSHGLWLTPNFAAGSAARRSGRPHVVAPRGMLSDAALAYSPLRKQLVWRWLQGPVARRAACMHATSDAEYEEIRAMGLTNPVAIVRNGIDLPAPCADRVPESGGARTILSLGRIHPKKGLDDLIRAWSQVEAPGWRLRIIGPPEGGHDEELRSLVSTLRLAGVSIEGPIYGDEKLAAYRQADLFVLPSLNENFGLSVAEALAAGTPVISTRGAPWSGLEREGCGWWVDNGAESLTAAIAAATAMPRPILRAMGSKGRTWMERDFSWGRVASDMIDVYDWLSGRGPPPAVVRLG